MQLQAPGPLGDPAQPVGHAQAPQQQQQESWLMTGFRLSTSAGGAVIAGVVSTWASFATVGSLILVADLANRTSARAAGVAMSSAPSSPILVAGSMLLVYGTPVVVGLTVGTMTFGEISDSIKRTFAQHHSTI